jgi:DNA topoisomerase-1
MQLILAEKPKVAKRIATAICRNIKQKRYGRVIYYEGTHNGAEIIVASAIGHIYTLAEKEKSNNYPVFDIEWRPAYEVDNELSYTKQYIALLEELGKKVDSFVSACDYDIEGSLIAGNVFRFAIGKDKEAKRMKFSALTNDELADAYDNVGELDYNNINAGEARHILDWYYGINLSRALMSALKSAERYKVLSIGRVQGPTLAILTELEKQIAAFVPTPYWELSIVVNGIEFLHTKGRFLDEKEAKLAFDNTGEYCTVAKLEKSQFQQYPNPCFDLTSLQVEAYRFFGFSPSKTLEIAQSLYENSFISYPRTSSQKIPPTINTAAIIRKIAENPAYSKEANILLENKWLRPFQGKKEDPAHPAIHPTGLYGKMNEQERKLYDLIVRRFLAAFAPPAVKERTKVYLDSNGEVYSASGVITLDVGWIGFYGKYYRGEEKEIPEFTENENVRIDKKKKTKKETKPPNRYSEASIVAELEARGLGTKATRSIIVDTLYKRGYIYSKNIRVSDFGLKVCEILERYAPEILDENLTRKIESDMEKIQEGKLEKEFVINEGKEILIQILDKWKKNEEAIGKELLEALKATEEKAQTIAACNRCGGNLRIIKMKGGKQFVGCSNYPQCNNIYPLPSSSYVTPTGKICEECGTPIVNIRRFKSKFSMCLDPTCRTKKEWSKNNKTSRGDEHADN